MSEKQQQVAAQPLPPAPLVAPALPPSNEKADTPKASPTTPTASRPSRWSRKNKKNGKTPDKKGGEDAVVEVESSPPVLPSVPFTALFRYSTRKEMALNMVGLICAGQSLL